MENDVLYNRIMNVVHEEYGSGSTAVANPEGEATDDLEKIQIGDEIYGISGGSDSGILVLHMVYDDDTTHLDQTYKTIRDAAAAGKLVMAIAGSDGEYFMYYVTYIGGESPELLVSLIDLESGDGFTYQASSENDYPVVLNE